MKKSVAPIIAARPLHSAERLSLSGPIVLLTNGGYASGARRASRSEVRTRLSR